MILDASQLAVVIASTAATAIFGMAAWQLRRHTLRQEKSALRREKKQELHYRKLDAVIFALASAAENISGASFQKNYEAKMREYERENDYIEA